MVQVDPKWEDEINHPDNMTARMFSSRKRASVDFKGDPASYRASHREVRDECEVPHISYVSKRDHSDISGFGISVSGFG